MPRVTLVIPLYNTPMALFLPCLSSAVGQSERDIEILLVDDGSDSAYREELAARVGTFRDTRVRVVLCEHGGVSSARNRGIGEAQGEYLAFIDSDDVLHPQFVSSLLRAAEETGAPVAVCGFAMTESAPTARDFASVSAKPQVIRGGDMWYRVNTGYVWNKLIAKSLLKGISFDTTLTVCEDQVFSYEVLAAAGECVYLDTPLYFHRYNAYGITGMMAAKKYADAYAVGERLITVPYVRDDPALIERVRIDGAVWLVQYMTALVREKGEMWRENLASARAEYRKVSAECVPARLSDFRYMGRLLRITKFAASQPYPVFRLWLSLLAYLKGRRNKKRKRSIKKQGL